MQLQERILRHLKELSLLPAGERVGVAVSGGADSVALLRLLIALRDELGIVLSVVHFNHKIRGAAADEDEQFVAGLARANGLELSLSAGDTVGFARRSGKTLETGARELRYAYFDHLLQTKALSLIATAHTQDDQAETVLMRLVRGSGTRGLAGIYPILRRAQGTIVRPLLTVRRRELLEYLRSIGQAWREDASNVDLRHTRNRIRHHLIPMLEQEFNPRIVLVLAELADIARGEEEFWTQWLRQIPSPANGAAVQTADLVAQPVAAQRRLLRRAAEQAGLTLDFEHVEALRRAAMAPTSTLETCELPNGTAAVTGRGRNRELRFVLRSQTRDARQPTNYEYPLSIPGELAIRETGTVIRASMVAAGSFAALLPGRIPSGTEPKNAENAGYNQAQLLDPSALVSQLTVRNWRAGDRFWPAHRKAPKKVKELLQKVTRAERSTWPVVAMGDQIVWMRGFPPSARFLLSQSDRHEGVLIEEVPRIKKP